MMCIRKPDECLRMVVDCRACNVNTVKDVTPFPDQDSIRADLARTKYMSKLDLADANEQILVKQEHVAHTTFSTPYGVFFSRVLQQGDCNGPVTFQHLMTATFQKHIPHFMHVYLDDIYIFSDSLHEHYRHVRTVLDTLHRESLFLNPKKVFLFASEMEFLGHIVKGSSIFPSPDKLREIRVWKPPENHFLGLVNYLRNFIPGLAKHAAPLANCCKGGVEFVWTDLLNTCFLTIKNIVTSSSFLTPINPNTPELIWVVCDASTPGVDAYYHQGKHWKNCQPAGFHSRKFTNTQ
jgi:hypothetical protein